jgi:hypothetical protein
VLGNPLHVNASFGDITRLMSKQPVTPATHREMIRRYPITGLVEGWYFRQEEVFAGCFVVEASDVYSRIISRQGVGDPEAAMAECIQFARRVGQPGPTGAEPGASPNGAPAASVGNSGDTEGPPSVS